MDVGAAVHGDLLTGTNLAAVSNFGEFEFWFAALKVAAIAIFLVLGLLAIFGVAARHGRAGHRAPHR